MGENNLFLGFSISAPWPEKLPLGRILEEKDRHLTMIFLGKILEEKAKNFFLDCDVPFVFSPAGIFLAPIFLPRKSPKVVAWLASHLTCQQELLDFEKYLSKKVAKSSDKEYLPHVTIARAPFDEEKWQASFIPLPFFLKSFCLYRSVGFSRYEKLMERKLFAPFEESEHTADLAFVIRGRNYDELLKNGELALAFKWPGLVAHFSKSQCGSIDEVIIALNEIVTNYDQISGIPVKGVSFHGKIEQKTGFLEWEMIVDV